jgi:hypothetical protein
MIDVTLDDLQASVRDRTAFRTLDDYFVHDVQRARRGQSIFGINSTFKSNHFLGYSVALNPLDGVYYVDPRPEMFSNERLRTQIADFQTFLVRDLWRLSSV